jgi:hypothetical protein
VTIPPIEQRQKWLEFQGAAKERGRISAINCAQLAENVWLINLQSNPGALAWLVVLAETCGLSYGFLYFEEKPQWLPHVFTPGLDD